MPRGYPGGRVPTELGRWAITPAPMAPEEIVDLIHRVRMGIVDAAGRGGGARSHKPYTTERLAELRSERTAEREMARAGARELRAPAAVPEVAQFPPGSTCALCCEPAVGALHRESLGRNGGFVNVCCSCSTEEPAGSARRRTVNAAVQP